MSGTTAIETGTFTLTRLVAFQSYGCGEHAAAARLPRRPRALPLPLDLVHVTGDNLFVMLP